jgi:hypothetical protein
MRNVTSVALITGVVLLTGCGPASSASDPTGGATPGNIPAGSATPAATGTPAGTGDNGPSQHRLLLRGQISGGFIGRGGPGALPEFSLYDDGSAIISKGGPGDIGPPTEYRLTSAALRRLITDAYAAGLNRSRTVDRAGVADATYLTLRFTAGGRTATTRIVQIETENDPAERFWTQRLHPDGTGFPKTDLARDPAPYRPARLAALASEAGQSAPERPMDWPLAPLGRGVRVGGLFCTLLTGRELVKATRLLTPAVAGRQWRSDGKVYLLRPRPLLPDESSCRALG